MRRSIFWGCLAWMGCVGLTHAAEKQPTAPTDPVYQALRQAQLGGKSLPVEDLKLQRDVLGLHFETGQFHFVQPAQDKTWLAVFEGRGKMRLEPATQQERDHLRMLTEQADLTALEDTFDSAVLAWTDGTFEELQAHGKLKDGAAPQSAAKKLGDLQELLREELSSNLELRILTDLLSTSGKGGYFLARIEGKRWPKLLYNLDPHGAAGESIGPEESGLLNADKNQAGLWYLASAKAQTQRPAPLYEVKHYQVQTAIDKKENVQGTALLHVVPGHDGLRVLPFALASQLRVQDAVLKPAGTKLVWLQEDKEQEPGVAVILPEPTKAGQPLEIQFTYAGDGILQDAGEKNFFVGWRTAWFPSRDSFSNFATYQLDFCIPEKLEIVSIGKLDKAWKEKEKDQSCSSWSTDVPMVTSGFNYGKFKKLAKKDPDTGLELEIYANTGTLDMLEGADLTMSTTQLMEDAMADALNSARTYTHFFGPLPFQRVAITQQAAGFYGQAWPTLIYLPFTAFLDSTQRMSLGIGGEGMTDFIQEVGPHEMSHQWWGHLVNWKSYRDQWLSEGFADFSAVLTLEQTEGPKRVREFWRDARKTITEKTRQGFKAYQVGPLSMGLRLHSHRSEGAYQRLVYSKGAYVLHMLRMMMQGPRGEDDRFIKMMKDFTTACRLKACSTQDFQAAVQRNMTPEMNLDGNGKMDWFFNQWVHGTQLPSFQVTSNFKKQGDKVHLQAELRQQGVSEDFKTLVPLYLELKDGRLVRIGTSPCTGTKPQKLDIDLPLKDVPKAFLINGKDDILVLD